MTKIVVASIVFGRVRITMNHIIAFAVAILAMPIGVALIFARVTFNRAIEISAILLTEVVIAQLVSRTKLHSVMFTVAIANPRPLLRRCTLAWLLGGPIDDIHGDA